MYVKKKNTIYLNCCHGVGLNIECAYLKVTFTVSVISPFAMDIG